MELPERGAAMAFAEVVTSRSLLRGLSIVALALAAWDPRGLCYPRRRN